MNVIVDGKTIYKDDELALMLWNAWISGERTFNKISLGNTQIEYQELLFIVLLLIKQILRIGAGFRRALKVNSLFLLNLRCRNLFIFKVYCSWLACSFYLSLVLPLSTGLSKIYLKVREAIVPTLVAERSNYCLHGETVVSLYLKRISILYGISCGTNYLISCILNNKNYLISGQSEC